MSTKIKVILGGASYGANAMTLLIWLAQRQKNKQNCFWFCVI